MVKKLSFLVFLLSLLIFVVGCPSNPTPPEKYTLNITITGQGAVSKTPDKSEYEKNENVELNATPNNGWEFSQWTGDVSGNENPKTFSMSSNKNITAVFTQIVPENHTLTVTASPLEGGEVGKDPSKENYEDGEMVTISATSDEDWHFIHWIKGNYIFDTNPSTSFVIEEDLDLTAIFEEDEVNIQIGWVEHPSSLIAGINDYIFYWNATVTEIIKADLQYVCTLDGIPITQDANEFSANDLSVGTHSFSVKAIYGSSESETLHFDFEYLGANVIFDVNDGYFYISITENSSPVEDAQLEITGGEFIVNENKFEATITCSVVLLEPEAFIKIAKILLTAALDNFLFPKESVNENSSGDFFKFYLSKLTPEYAPSEIKIYARGSISNNEISFNGPGQLSYDPNHPEQLTDSGTMTAKSLVYIDEDREVNLVGEPEFTLNTEGWNPTVKIKQADDFEYSQE
ncbi:MAG: hypothetical protein PWQ77_1490 [Kosmotogales bacterium]|nr:hypothetical protein [Kosmotogales bacterium]